MFLVNSRLGRFSATASRRHPLSRSYGVILPSSLTRVLSRALGFSPRLPVSVCGTDTGVLTRGFSRQFGVSCFAPPWCRSHSRLGLTPGGFACQTPCSLRPVLPFTGSTYPPVSPLRSNERRWHGNFNPLSIAYAFRPRLRSRLTLSGRTFLRKP